MRLRLRLRMRMRMRMESDFSALAPCPSTSLWHNSIFNVILAALLARNPSPVCDAPPWHRRAGGNRSAAVAHSFLPGESGVRRVRRLTEVVVVTRGHGSCCRPWRAGTRAAEGKHPPGEGRYHCMDVVRADGNRRHPVFSAPFDPWTLFHSPRHPPPKSQICPPFDSGPFQPVESPNGLPRSKNFRPLIQQRQD